MYVGYVEKLQWEFIPIPIALFPFPYFYPHSRDIVPFPWESHGSHGIPIVPIPMHICNVVRVCFSSEEKKTEWIKVSRCICIRVVTTFDHCRAMLRMSTAYAVMQYLSVRLSVCIYSVKTNKNIFRFFSPSGSHTVLVFFHIKRHGIIPTETP